MNKKELQLEVQKLNIYHKILIQEILSLINKGAIKKCNLHGQAQDLEDLIENISTVYPENRNDPEMCKRCIPLLDYVFYLKGKLCL